MTRFISLFLFIISLFWLYLGMFYYDFWENNGPGSGFIPVIASSIIAIFSLNIFIKNVEQGVSLKRKQFYPVLASVFLIGLIKVIGMTFSLALFMVGWLFLLEKFTLIRSLIYGVATTSVIYIIFKASLGVPLPEGFFGI